MTAIASRTKPQPSTPYRRVIAGVARTVNALAVLLMPSATWAAEPANMETRLAAEWAAEFAGIEQDMAASQKDSLRLYRPGSKPQIPVADPHNLIWESDQGPVDVALRRTAALLEDLSRQLDAKRSREFARRLEELRAKTDDNASDQDLFVEICRLRRQIALSNPLLDFDQIIYAKGDGGWNGGLYHTAPFGEFHKQIDVWWDPNRKELTNKWTVDDWLGGFDFTKSQGEETPNPVLRTPLLFSARGWRESQPEPQALLFEAMIANGRNAGKVLSAFPGACHFAFDLSYDGREVVFATSLGQTGPRHIFRATLDGRNVQQLTDSWFADWEPIFLPNGRIVFVSLRRWIAARCQSGFPQACGTLFSMAGDGSDLYPISWHETSEQFPVVANDGRLVYSRWDYIDRGTAIAHNLWTCYPDGRDPRAPHGNYGPPNAKATEPALLERVRGAYGEAAIVKLSKEQGLPYTVAGRPVSESYIRPVPNQSGLYVGIAGVHHGSGYGTPVLIDTNLADDGQMSQVRIIRGDGIPAEFSMGNQYFPREGRYCTPWPLSDRYFLVTRLQGLEDRGIQTALPSPHMLKKSSGIYLMDRFGNVELLVPDDGVSPRPLAARPAPPVLPTATWQGVRENLPDHRRAVVSIVNAYTSNLVWPKDTHLKALRIIQILPIPWGGYENKGADTKDQDRGNFSLVTGWYGNGRSCMRMVLGTVPLEKDGSAYFEAPVGKEISFQVLDENGMAVQSMRSGTYVHPGEHLSCAGCHSTDTRTKPEMAGTPLAFMRAPSRIMPEPEGSLPLTYARLVQPVMERTCVPCHLKEKKGPRLADFRSLMPYVEVLAGTGTYGTTDTKPGEFGAHGSKLGKKLLTTHKDRVSAEEKRRLIVWMDANSLELGALHKQPQQRAGQVVWPLQEVDPSNPIGIETIVPSR